MRPFKALLILTLLVTLASVSRPIQAQGEGPEPVGLRPDAPTYAKHGPYWVGTQAFDAKTDFHPTTIQVWYPALNPSDVPETVTYRQFIPGLGKDITLQGHAIDHAPPLMTDAPYPLIIFAVGSGGVRFYYAYLTEHLASYGFVVMAIDYADSAALPGNVDPALSLYTRPKDLSWQIDYASRLMGADGALPGLIDSERIAVVGHSFGAYTAQMAGGARLDLSGPTSWCVQYPNLTWPPETGRPYALHDMCTYLTRTLVGAAGLPSAPEALWPSWEDGRVKAIVPLAPEVVEFGANSFKAMTIPTFLMVGTRDRLEFSDLPLYQPYLYDHLGSATKALVTFANADHAIFALACSEGPWMVEGGTYWTCSDRVWDMARAHDLTNHFTTAFLLDVLKGDKNAHQALVPVAVRFPGIEYQTTLK